MSKVIMIDPGHGGFDPGASNLSGKRKEKDYTLKVSMRLWKKLKDAGVNASLTRSTDATVGDIEDTSKTLIARVAKANNQSADLLFSIHFNASQTHTAKGSEIYVYDADDAVKSLANNVVRAVGATLGFHGEPVKKENFYVIRKFKNSMLLEVEYIDNDAAMDIFDANMDKIVNDIAAVLIPYALGGKPSPKPVNDYDQHQFTSSIHKAINAKIMTDYNGMFRPNDGVTRGELAAILDRLGLLDHGES